MYASEGFSRRRNADGSFDSICHKCFRTVASTLCEPKLEIGEKEHNCDQGALSQRDAFWAQFKPHDQSMEAHRFVNKGR